MLRDIHSFLLFALFLSATVGCSDDSDDSDDSPTSTSDGDGTGTGTGTAGTAGTGTAGTGTGTGTGTDTGDDDPLACNRAATPDQTITEHIGVDTTWSGTILVNAMIRVNSEAHLTITPGTTVLFTADAGIEVGWNSSAATITAEGTVDQPIHLCGLEAQAGYWSGLVVRRNVTSNSSFNHLQVADGGGGGASIVLEAEISVKNTSVTRSASDGVQAVSFASDSQLLSVSDVVGDPVALTGAGALARLPLGGNLGDPATKAVAIRFRDIDVDTMIANPGIPYRQQEPVVRIVNGANVTFLPGVHYLFEADGELDIGWNSNQATVHAVGTEVDPIVFRGVVAEAGWWQGIIVQRNVTTNSVFQHVNISHGGGEASPVMNIAAPILLNGVTLETNELGMLVKEQGLKDGSANLTVRGTGHVPLVVTGRALLSVPHGGDYTGNADDRIEVLGRDLDASGTVVAAGVPYLVSEDLRIVSGAKVTIEAGVSFHLAADVGIIVGWNANDAEIAAIGSAVSPISFVGVDAQPGYWSGITIGRNAKSSSTFEYVTIGHAGQGNGANLTLERAFNITNSTLHDSAGFGILRQKDDATDYLTSNGFERNALGSVGEL